METTGRWRWGVVLVGVLATAGCRGSDVPPGEPGPLAGGPTGDVGGDAPPAAGGPATGAGEAPGSVLPEGPQGAGAPPREEPPAPRAPEVAQEPPPAADAGVEEAVATLQFPGAPGWRFYGTQHGGPREVYGAAADEGGNVWVAGGEEGLFLLRPGAAAFERFTMADGLRPYGFMADGSAPPGDKYLKVLSVAGGPPGTVFVGYGGLGSYQSKPVAPGVLECEVNFDTAARDPAIYKSGDADRVELTASGIRVVHYDIFSGPGVNEFYPQGREKVCSVYRIAWDKWTNSVWFAGNHAFARGRADYEYTPGADGGWCNGQRRCEGVEEHVHPAVNAYKDEAKTRDALLTWMYAALALEPNGDVWVGGYDRSTRFRYGALGRDFWRAQGDTESGASRTSKLDIWPDAVKEWATPSQRTSDGVSGIARAPDGTVYVASSLVGRGVARLDANGNVLGYITDALHAKDNGSIAADSRDGSIWVGGNWGGITRLRGDAAVYYGKSLLGSELTQLSVVDIQMQGSGTARKVLVAFKGKGRLPGAVGVYEGE